MDIVVKSIMSDDLLVLDRQNRLRVPSAFVERDLSIQVGGHLNAQATAIDFRNSTIDFNGASVNNFIGNIDGNVNLSGNVTGQFVIAERAFIGRLQGNTFGIVNTSQIETPFSGARITGPDGVDGGSLNGILSGEFAGNVSLTNMSPIAPSEQIHVMGNLVLEPGASLSADSASFSHLNALEISSVFPFTFIDVNADISMAPGTFLVGNAALEVLTVERIESIIFGGEIVIDGTMNFLNTPVYPVQLANTVFAAPDSIDGEPEFRSLVSSDIPILDRLLVQESSGNSGQATLVSGTVTIPNLNISSNDMIFLSRSDFNGSIAIGFLLYTITPGASFTITSFQSDALTAEVNDQSVIQYFIVGKT
jgi:hypothetical protein